MNNQNDFSDPIGYDEEADHGIGYTETFHEDQRTKGRDDGRCCNADKIFFSETIP